MPKVTGCSQTIVHKLRQLGSAEVGRKAGVNRSYLSHIFHGRRWPSLQVGHRIAEILGVSMDELHAHLEHVREKKRRAEGGAERVEGGATAGA